MPTLTTESTLRTHTTHDSRAASLHSAQAAWREGREPRVSLARVIQLDDLSQQTIPLRSVWRRLAEGGWLAVISFQTDDRFYFVLEPRSGRACRPWPRPEQVIMLRRVLLSERQKVMAYDTASSNSTVATRLAYCLNAMGFWPRASRVPALLVAMAAAEEGRTQIYDARCTYADQDGIPQVIVSTPRLDSFLATLLTCEEFKVARLLVEGMSYADIALNRGSAVRTVANHISSIFRKLGVSGRPELLLFLALNFRAPSSSEARLDPAVTPSTAGHEGVALGKHEVPGNCPAEGALREP